jgi:superfamily I DNA/RNA helicase
MSFNDTTSNYLLAEGDLQRNDRQWAAYCSCAHCVVLAGPGSGKTKVLTTKLARMLAEEVRAPRGIACITYNNQCVRELKKRLGKLGIEEGLVRLLAQYIHFA